ncbi:hypothetical protein GC722_14960 [Auraticoccus sp. F435]|uniref:Uncharacterized protein n=1 Tax=Auraticoccus cholistanensis TaxID=2656650 RepID=A0A6A9UX72_9ACTN|nr:hypothetical protein [Auraticoccus cholistanensis]
MGVHLEGCHAPMPDCHLVYIYDSVTDEPICDPEDERLMPSRLAIGPAFVNRLLWSKGFFRTVTEAELKRHYLLRTPVFRLMQELVDDCGNAYDGPVDGPVGTWGLMSYSYLDDRLSERFNLPLAPS